MLALQIVCTMTHAMSLQRLSVSPALADVQLMLDICCTVLHTDGLLLVAQQCCIRRALLRTCARETCPTHPTLLGTPPRTPSWGAAAFGIPSAGPSVRAFCDALVCECERSCSEST